MATEAVTYRPPPTPRILYVLIGVNAAVFVGWLLAGAGVGGGWLRELMAWNFAVSRDHLEGGHVWTLLTSEFSHREIWHIALNMMVLYSFGTVLVWRWGAPKFLVFYLAAAVVASIGHVGVGWLIDRNEPALGASGAVSGVMAAFAFLYPRHRVLIFGVVPLPAWMATLLFVGLDLWGVAAQSAGGGLPIGHGAHLGGAAFGLVYSLVGRWRRPPPAAVRASPFS